MVFSFSFAFAYNDISKKVLKGRGNLTVDKNNKNKPKTTIHHIKIQQPSKPVIQAVNKPKTNMEVAMEEHGPAITIAAFLIGVLGIGLGALSVHSARANRQAGEVAMVQKVNTYKNLQKEYKKVAHVPGIDISSGTERLVSGTKQGDKLAALQNQYATAGTGQKAIRKISKGIAQLMASSKEETTPWYYTGHKKDEGTWEFDSRFAFTQSKAPVVFTCTAKDGALLAYTTADYLAASKEFKNVKTVVTDIGNNRAANSEKKKGMGKKQMQGLVKKAQEQFKGQKFNKITRKEADALEKHRQQEYEEAKKKGQVKY